MGIASERDGRGSGKIRVLFQDPALTFKRNLRHVAELLHVKLCYKALMIAATGCSFVRRKIYKWRNLRCLLTPSPNLKSNYVWKSHPHTRRLNFFPLQAHKYIFIQNRSAENKLNLLLTEEYNLHMPLEIINQEKNEAGSLLYKKRFPLSLHACL